MAQALTPKEIPLRIANHDGTSVPIGSNDAHALESNGFIDQAEDNETGEPIPDTYHIDPELLDMWASSNPPLSAGDMEPLARWLPLLNKRGPLTDTEALDLINYALSAPSWSVSFLEDINAIIRERTDRTEIRGACWARH